ncbi:hypothetical protein MMC28_001559 [Mycoblastus sanguinarius]|nr:hypothetical protein [Mycoblastus sanguinarius]
MTTDQMKLSVQLYDGKTIALEVVPTIPIASLKSLIEPHHPMEGERLIFDKIRLDDELSFGTATFTRTLNTYRNIKDGAVLRLGKSKSKCKQKAKTSEPSKDSSKSPSSEISNVAIKETSGEVSKKGSKKTSEESSKDASKNASNYASKRDWDRVAPGAGDPEQLPWDGDSTASNNDTKVDVKTTSGKDARLPQKRKRESTSVPAATLDPLLQASLFAVSSGSTALTPLVVDGPAKASTTPVTDRGSLAFGVPTETNISAGRCESCGRSCRCTNEGTTIAQKAIKRENNKRQRTG